MADVSYNIIDRINLEDLCKSIGAFIAVQLLLMYAVAWRRTE